MLQLDDWPGAWEASSDSSPNQLLHLFICHVCFRKDQRLGSNESLQFTLHTLCNFRNIELSNSYDLSSPRTPKALYELSEQMEKIHQVHFQSAQSMQLHTHSKQMGNSDKPKSKFQDLTQLLILKSPVSCWGLT